MLATREVARDVILPRYRALATHQIDTKRDDEDLVTVSDREAEARLTEEALRILPGIEVVGEEAASQDAGRLSIIGEAERVLIIDPIDGTWNFAHGINSFGVILAMVEEGRTVWGGLYDPLLDDWMTARAGEGAEFVTDTGKRAPIRLRDGPSVLADAIGSLPLYMYDGETQRRLFATLPDFKRIGTLRCSLHEYRQLAGGQNHFGLTAMLHPWDHAAGALICAEAGCTVRLIDGRDYAPTMTDGRLLVARSPALWDAVAERLSFLAAPT